jgi:hypothetical protein
VPLDKSEGAEAKLRALQPVGNEDALLLNVWALEDSSSGELLGRSAITFE